MVFKVDWPLLENVGAVLDMLKAKTAKHESNMSSIQRRVPASDTPVVITFFKREICHA